MIKKGDEFPEEPADEKPILHVGGVQAVYTENIPQLKSNTPLLGHLHRMHTVDRESKVLYSGSPLSYSFAEANQQKYVLILTLKPAKK